MADNLRRWGEQLVGEGKRAEATAKINEAYQTADEAVIADPEDERALQTLRECALEKACLAASAGQLKLASSAFDEAMISRPVTAKQRRHAAKVCYRRSLAMLKAGKVAEATDAYRIGDQLRLHDPDERQKYEALKIALQSHKTGVVIRVDEDKGYGFIEAEGVRYFAHISRTKPRLTNEEFKLLEGQPVAFQVAPSDGGPNAQAVDIVALPA